MSDPDQTSAFSKLDAGEAAGIINCMIGVGALRDKGFLAVVENQGASALFERLPRDNQMHF